MWECIPIHVSVIALLKILDVSHFPSLLVASEAPVRVFCVCNTCAYLFIGMSLGSAAAVLVSLSGDGL